MKTTLHFLLLILIFTFSEANAQKSDSIGITPIMQRKSQIFIAEIKMNIGTKKGILYEADSSGIVILDSLYQRVSIPLIAMKSLKIYRSNAGFHGAKVGFLTPLIPFTAIGALFVVSAGGVVLNGYTQAFFLIGLLSGAICGIFFALINPLIPNTTIRERKDFSEKYYKKLRYSKFKTQQSLIQRHPKKIRLVYHNSTE